jgi:hypothetical protein
MNEIRIKAFQQISLYEMDTVNNFLEEIGDSVISVNSFPYGSSNQYFNFVVSYNVNDYNKNNSIRKVKSFRDVADLNVFLKKIGDRFISKSAVYDNGYTYHYVDYYELIQNTDSKSNSKSKSEEEKKIEKEKALG